MGATLWVRLSAVSFLAKKPEKDAAAILRAVTVEIYEMGFLIYDLRNTTYEYHCGQSLASEKGKLVRSNKLLIDLL